MNDQIPNRNDPDPWDFLMFVSAHQRGIISTEMTAAMANCVNRAQELHRQGKTKKPSITLVLEFDQVSDGGQIGVYHRITEKLHESVEGGAIYYPVEDADGMLGVHPDAPMLPVIPFEPTATRDQGAISD